MKMNTLSPVTYISSLNPTILFFSANESSDTLSITQ